ncbi:MAG TPA: hypothetical protein VJ044_18930, partial [Candidatus Hodarchaeales archaeon]|nr:hypothetical protein [Candidatus Hodarchaeales archaeon]
MTGSALRYFGTSGIRGRTFIDITPEFALKMAQAYSIVIKQAVSSPVIVVGRDPRYGAETLEHAIIAGLTVMGV